MQIDDGICDCPNATLDSSRITVLPVSLSGAGTWELFFCRNCGGTGVINVSFCQNLMELYSYSQVPSVVLLWEGSL